MNFKRAVTAEQRNQRRKEIAKSAERILVNEGYNELTISRISQELTIKRSVIYSYFNNVPEILLYCLSLKIDELCKVILNSLNDDKASISIILVRFEEDVAFKTLMMLYGPVMINNTRPKYKVIFIKKVRVLLSGLNIVYPHKEDLDEKFAVRLFLGMSILVGASRLKTMTSIDELNSKFDEKKIESLVDYMYQGDEVFLEQFARQCM